MKSDINAYKKLELEAQAKKEKERELQELFENDLNNIDNKRWVKNWLEQNVLDQNWGYIDDDCYFAPYSGQEIFAREYMEYFHKNLEKHMYKKLQDKIEESLFDFVKTVKVVVEI